MKNAHAITSKAPQEWGRQDRQDEAALRGFRRRGREDAVREALDEMRQDAEIARAEAEAADKADRDWQEAQEAEAMDRWLDEALHTAVREDIMADDDYGWDGDYEWERYRDSRDDWREREEDWLYARHYEL